MKKYILLAFLAVNSVAAGGAQRLRGLADEAHHFIACGDTKKLCGSDPFLPASPDEEHEVRCCSDSRITGYKRTGGCRFYVASELVPLSGGKAVCHNSATYSEAEAICEKNNGRLCTKDEILSRCTRNTGCNHDYDHLWTSTEVPTDTPAPTASPPPPPPLPEGTKLYLACGHAGDNKCGKEVTTNVAELDEQHEVRCCSDTPISKWKKWASCGVWGESDLFGLDGGDKTTCHTMKTYEEAVAICYANNARLCTKSEILYGCTARSGCSMDKEMIWTSTIYDEAAVDAAAAASEAPVCEGPSGSVWGDPHVTSFDGYKYDCQGQGEYVIVQSKCSGDPLRVHGRFVDGSTEQMGQGTITRSVAIKVSENVPVAYISVPDKPSDGYCPMLYAIGNEGNAIPVNEIIDHFLDNYDGNARLYLEGTSVILTYPESGTRIEVTPKKSKSNGCVLRINVCITPEKHGCADCIAGLIGTPNGIRSDDWTTLDGDALPLPIDGNLLQQGFDYCRANWCVGEYENSLYGFESFNKYNRCFENTFDAAAIQERIDALPAAVIAKCEETDDADACKLDAAMELDGTETDSTAAGLEAAESILQDKSDAENVHSTTETQAEANEGVSQSTTTSNASSGTDVDSTGTSKTLDVEKCLGDGKILLTKEEEDQPLPGGTIEIVPDSSNGQQVTFTVEQLWKTDDGESISWIAPVFRQGNDDMYCDESSKIEEVGSDDPPTPYTIDCNATTGWAEVVLYVHDGSFKTSAAENEHHCKGWGNDNGIATYHFKLSCNDGATCSSSTIIESGATLPPGKTWSTDAVCNTTTLSTNSPTPAPTAQPTANPTPAPTSPPTANPTPEPTAQPTANPTPAPTLPPTANPTPEPTAQPTANPTPGPTSPPTANPTPGPTRAPVTPTEAPAPSPTEAPTRPDETTTLPPAPSECLFDVDSADGATCPTDGDSILTYYPNDHNSPSPSDVIHSVTFDNAARTVSFKVANPFGDDSHDIYTMYDKPALSDAAGDAVCFSDLDRSSCPSQEVFEAKCLNDGTGFEYTVVTVYAVGSGAQSLITGSEANIHECCVVDDPAADEGIVAWTYVINCCPDNVATDRRLRRRNNKRKRKF